MILDTFPITNISSGFGWSHWIDTISGIIVGGVKTQIDRLKLRFFIFAKTKLGRRCCGCLARFIFMFYF